MLRSKKWRIFTWVYITVCTLDIIALNLQVKTYDLHMIFKPLIMAVAIYFLIRYLSDKKYYKWVLAAFVFSWLGDILLLGQQIDDLFFVGGLGSFLLAHIAYIVFFQKSTYRKRVIYRGITVLQAAIVLMAVSFYALMYSHLNELWLPVLLYVLTIAIMGVKALSRYARVNMDAFSYTVVGAFTFVLSDSIIGYSKFVADIPFSESLIMLFYCTAQYMILKGFVVLKLTEED